MAQRGVSTRSMMGSEAMLRNMTVLPRAPDSAKSRRKKSAVSFLMPMAQKTVTNLASSPSVAMTRAWRTICAASSLWLMPAPEKMGSFWPLMRVQVASMELMPVRMKLRGYSRETGFMAAPFMSRRSAA